MSDVSISIKKDINLKNSMVILGLPTLGLIGSIAGNYIADSLDLDLVGSIHSKYFLPGVIIRDSTPIPPIRLYYASDELCDQNDLCSSLLTLVSDFPVPQSAVYPVMDKLIHFAEENDTSLFLGIEGIKSEDKKDSDVDVYGVGTTQEMNKILRKHDIEETKDILINGLNGALLSEQMENKKDMICMLTEGHTRFPDSRAAGRLLEKIDDMLPGIHLDLEPLYEDAEKIEQKITQYIKKSAQISAPKSSDITEMYQ